MKKIIPMLLVMLGLILVAIPVKLFNHAKTTKYESIQTNIWLPAKAVIIRGWIVPDLYFDPMVAPTKISLADFKSGFPEEGVVTYPEVFGSNRRLGATVWHSDRDGRLYFTNQPVQKPDYLPWYVYLQLELKDGKLVANPVAQELGLLWFLFNFVGICLLVLSVMLWRLSFEKKREN